MEYALLFYNGPPTEIPAAQRERVISDTMADMRAWQESMRREGVYKTGMRLAQVDTATSVRTSGGELIVVDGPFAETKEFLAGLVVIECADLDAALAWAKKCPIARFGTVEVRPEYGS